jgi:hypothetical protein
LADEGLKKGEEVKQEVKQGWSSWLGLGKSKVQEGKSEAAYKVDKAAGEVKKETEKRV